MNLPALPLLLALVAGQRLAELYIAQRNTKRLIAAGGVETGARHYPLFIVLHVAWLLAMALFIPLDSQPNLLLLLIFLLLQLGRAWVMTTLGGRWTTRIITLPGAPRIETGLYRIFRHPNYVIVALEIAVLPMVFGAWRIAVVFSLLSGALTLWRIHVEDRALG